MTTKLRRKKINASSLKGKEIVVTTQNKLHSAKHGEQVVGEVITHPKKSKKRKTEDSSSIECVDTVDRSAPALRKTSSFRLDLSETALQIHDYRGYHFTAKNLPLSLEGYVLDRASLQSLMALSNQGDQISFYRTVFYQTDFTGLVISNYNFSQAKFFNCELTNFFKCNFTGATFNSDCHKARFIDCTLRFANFTGAINLSANQIQTSKDWNEAKFSTPTLIQMQFNSTQATTKNKKSFFNTISNLFGDGQENTALKHTDLNKNKEQKTSRVQLAKTINDSDKSSHNTANFELLIRSPAAEAADRLQQHYAKKGEVNFQKKLIKERIERGKDAEERLRNR